MKTGEGGGGLYSAVMIANAKAMASAAKSGATTNDSNVAASPHTTVLVGENVAAAKTGVVISEWDPALAALLSGESL